MVKRGWEVRSRSQGGLYRGLRVGVVIMLLSSAILPRGDFLEGAGQSLVSRLSNLRLMVGLLSGIFVRTGLDGSSLCRWIDAEWLSLWMVCLMGGM